MDSNQTPAIAMPQLGNSSIFLPMALVCAAVGVLIVAVGAIVFFTGGSWVIAAAGAPFLVAAAVFARLAFLAVQRALATWTEEMVQRGPSLEELQGMLASLQASRQDRAA